MKPEELKLINRRREWLRLPKAEEFKDDVTPCACGLFVTFDAHEEWTDATDVTHSRDRCF
jgi:hypothetical protein